MVSVFQVVLQSYYTPAVVLLIFAGILVSDQLLSRREKLLFLMELTVVGMLFIATWIDICAATVREGDVCWRIRAFTSTLQFSLVPLSPLLLQLLYNSEYRLRHGVLFFLPAAVNFLVTMTSLCTGLVIRVTYGNIYSRGPLFPLPFLASALYLLGMLHYLSLKESPGRRMETKAMICVILAVIGASACEITMNLRCILWSATTACLVLLFLVMTTKKVLYDTLTGAYSRLAYHKRLDIVHDRRDSTLAMIDINGLKAISDNLGHAAGDRAIIQIAQSLLAIRLRGLKLYRYGGDEFVLIGNGCVAGRLEGELEQALGRCGQIEGLPLSFAYGIREYSGGDLQAMLEEMDQEMYRRKQAMKGQPSSVAANQE